jgi:peptidoglycan hydrolase CwlO-like protein
MAFIKVVVVNPGMEALMSEVETIKAKVEALSEQVSQMQARVTEDVQSLKDQIAQHDIDATVLEEINSGLDRITERVRAIDPDPNSPSGSGEPEPTS